MRFKKALFLTGIILLYKLFKEKGTRRERKSNFVNNKFLSSKRTKPNILFIIADDLGFNDVGYHGSEIKTPNIDRLASTGVRLENYYVQPVCTPTRGQLLTGRYQIHTGLHWVLWPATPAGLSLDNPTIADRLREAGYATHMVGKWHLGFYKPEYLPTRRGFDTFFGFLSGHSDYYTHITGNYLEKRMFGYDLMENDKPASIREYNGTYSTHLFGSKVKDIIYAHEIEKPMFIYLSFQAVHAPLQVPDKYVRQYEHIEDANRRLYAGMVTCMDEIIGDIVEAMKRRSIWNDTVLIFTTDNGGNPNVGGSNFPLKGTKSTLWEGGIRAVGFVNSPLVGNSRSGYVSNELMHVTDWFPTLTNLAGAELEGSKQLDGYDQWQTIKYGIRSPRNEILHNIDPLFNNTFYKRRSSLRLGAWKIIIGQLDTSGSIGVGDAFSKRGGRWILFLIFYGGKTYKIEHIMGTKAPKYQHLEDGAGSRKKQPNGFENICLFNIESDPSERIDLSEEFPEIVRNMLQRLEEYDRSSVQCEMPDIDESANPIYHDGFWQPWQ